MTVRVVFCRKHHVGSLLLSGQEARIAALEDRL